jgi:hypothetical protein
MTESFIVGSELFEVEAEYGVYGVIFNKEHLVYLASPDLHREVLQAALERLGSEGRIPEFLAKLPPEQYFEI